MDNSAKRLIVSALAVALLLGPLAGFLSAEAVRPGSSTPSPRRSITITEGMINYTVPQPTTTLTLPGADLQSSPTPRSVVIGFDAPVPVREAAAEPVLTPVPTPSVIQILRGAESTPPPTPRPTAVVPTPTPAGPTPIPALTPRITYVAPGTLSVIYVPGLWPGKQEIIVTNPDGSRTGRTIFERSDYSPDRKTLDYPLLLDAYRQVYLQLFGIRLTTPPPTSTPTPEGYEPPPPSPTPEYCKSPLEIGELEGLSLTKISQSSQAQGWAVMVGRAEAPTRYPGYGYIWSNERKYVETRIFPVQPVSLLLYSNGEPYTVRSGDYVTFTYDSSQTLKVYLPVISGVETQYCYIGADGRTYADRWLCRPISFIPPPTPIPSPSPTPSPNIYCRAPLEIRELKNMWIAHPRSAVEDGWLIRILSASAPGDSSHHFGLVWDNENKFDEGEKWGVPGEVAIRIENNTSTGPFAIQTGDYVTLTYIGYGGLESLNVYLPPVRGSTSVYYYIAEDGSTYNDAWLCDLASIVPPATPAPTPPVLVLDSGDYNGDGTSDIAVFRPDSGLWAIRGATRAYYGKSGDIPVSGDYANDGSTDIAVFRPSSGLWAVRGLTRFYFGTGSDIPVPGDYDRDGKCEPGIFRPYSGLWALRGVTRVYFGDIHDRPVPGYFQGKAAKNLAVFRPSSGLWAIRGVIRFYFGRYEDWPVSGDYSGNGKDDPGIFRPSSGLWAIRGLTRFYYGGDLDRPVSGDFRGTDVVDIGVFRESSGLWGLKGLSRVYFGGEGDLPLAAPPCRPVSPSPTLTPKDYKTPTVTPTPQGYKTPVLTPTPISYKTPSPAPSPTVSPPPPPPATPPPGVFDLEGTISAGAPIWSLWADESYLYAGLGDGSVKIWSRGRYPADFSLQTRIVVAGDETIYGLAGSPGTYPHHLYGSGSKGRIYAWDHQFHSGKWTVMTAIDLYPGSSMNAVVADKDLVFGGNNNEQVYVLNAADFSLETVLAVRLGPVLSLSLDADYLYSGAGEGVVSRWDRQTDGPAYANFTASDQPVWATEADEYYFYAGGSSPVLKSWLKADLAPQTGADPPGPVESLSADQRSHIFGVGDDGDLYVWSASDFSLQTVSPGSSQTLHSVFADRYRSGVSYTRYIFGGGQEGRIYLWLGERTPTPIGYKTPPPTATITPELYCNNSLNIAVLENLWISQTRSDQTDGWYFRVTRAISPEDVLGYGFIYDNQNSFQHQTNYDNQPVALFIFPEQDNFNIQSGDYLKLTYDSSQICKVYLPANDGSISESYYIGADGSTYNDRWLCQTAADAGEMSMLGAGKILTVPELSPTVVVPQLPPSTPSSVPRPVEGTFDLVGTIEVFNFKQYSRRV